MIFLMSRDPFPICSSTFGDYLNFWGSATQKFSPSFHIKNHMPKKKKTLIPSQNMPTKISFHTNKKFPWPKIMHRKKINVPKNKNKKINAPRKFYHNQNFSHNHAQLPKFSHKKITTCPCTTTKFSHVQNHNNKIFSII